MVKNDLVNVYKINKKTKLKEFDYSGSFLFFGEDYEEFECGPGRIPVAIILKEDGFLESVYVDLVQLKLQLGNIELTEEKASSISLIELCNANKKESEKSCL